MAAPDIHTSEESHRQSGKARLAVTHISLTNFRSYQTASFATDGRPVVLAGPNGAGKTNVLDALSLLAPGRGLRSSKLSEHIRRGPAAPVGVPAAPGGRPAAPGGALWAVAATVSRDGEEFQLGTGLTVGPNGGERRVIRLNGAPAASSADLGEIVQMIWLTPSMDRLFIEGASGRRKFLDRLTVGFDAGHARVAARYETAMRERARLLKFGPRDPAWLDGLEGDMAESGVVLAKSRAQAVARLNAMLKFRGEAGAFPAAELTLDGEADAIVAEEAGGDVALAAFQDKLAAMRVRDAEAGRTGFGPHRTDLVVRHTGKHADARACSTGEQKALLISIVLAYARELAADHPAPVLLLDEVAAHLDKIRRTALFDEILDLRAQAWITGTDTALFADFLDQSHAFKVDDSVISPL